MATKTSTAQKKNGASEDTTQKIRPCLWFDGNAEEAVNFYTSLFKNSKVSDVSRWGEGGMAPAGTVLTITFELDGEQMIALNGGPEFKFTEAISLSVDCKDQAEVDKLWSKLTADGGEESVCGWLKDKFGLSWQIVPRRLIELLADPDPKKSQAAMQAMMQMKKIDVAELEKAAAAA
jgi:predicted 3-demethylubiquinone-9 3-methyltransferase (glyoxalase superfamily)